MSPKKNTQEKKAANIEKQPEGDVHEETIEGISRSLSRMMINSSTRLAEALCEEYNLDSDRVNEISSKVLASFIGEIDGMFMKPLKPAKLTKVDKEVTDEEMCKFVLLRGDRKGEICSKRATKGFDFCSVHKASMIKKGELVGKVEEVKNKGLEFIPHEEDAGTYTVKGTKLVVVRLDLQKDMDIDNCEVVGHLSGGNVLALDGTNKKIAEINGLKVGDDFMVVDDKSLDVIAK
ncbi:hypothetical protein GGH94_000857 [Coemansia aciculifera]|uniref:Uncharacterized protein n=1 Tax=Coemansia aciculifera TaxID=417176 RepID=A0A9W8ITQ7_9FUNG|nr:hypothetical protein GGH94_000857 [Coemansia aciculifera]KAJ2876527.1 hypothetical protein GGH93_000688 [Coemansia aciculifera]